MAVELPEDARMLIDAPNLADLVTLMKDGSPQVTPLWIDRDGDILRVNTALGRQKALNLRRDPRVALLILDRNSGFNWVQIRGRVIDMIEGEPAWQHIEKLAGKYTGRTGFTRRESEERVMILIEPQHLTVSGGIGGMPRDRGSSSS
jgi:PPOX class probable F420-dependent enzyme